MPLNKAIKDMERDKFAYDSNDEIAVRVIGEFVNGGSTILKRSILTKTASYNMNIGDDVILIDASSGNVTIKLPIPITGATYTIQALDVTNTAKVIPNGLETLYRVKNEGLVELEFESDGQGFDFCFDGTDWVVL